MRKYRLVAKKGEGTFSEVLKAQNVKDGKYHAIKCMKNRFDSIDQVNNLREIQALRRLSPHEHIVALEEVLYDQPTGRLALVFELMDANLYELIKGRKHYLNPNLVKSYMWQLMKSLDHMHKKGIFHRDIKPENILIEKDACNEIGRGLKLADFGSCRGIYSKQPYTEYISTRWYRAPECLLTDGYYGPEMDLWGAGCVMFEISSLYPLFPGTNELDQINRIHKVLGTPPEEILNKFKAKGAAHISFDFPPTKGVGLPQLLTHVSADTLDLIDRLLRYDWSDRISAREAMRHPYFKDIREQEAKKAQLAAAALQQQQLAVAGQENSENNNNSNHTSTTINTTNKDKQQQVNHNTKKRNSTNNNGEEKVTMAQLPTILASLGINNNNNDNTSVTGSDSIYSDHSPRKNNYNGNSNNNSISKSNNNSNINNTGLPMIGTSTHPSAATGTGGIDKLLKKNSNYLNDNSVTSKTAGAININSSSSSSNSSMSYNTSAKNAGKANNSNTTTTNNNSNNTIQRKKNKAITGSTTGAHSNQQQQQYQPYNQPQQQISLVQAGGSKAVLHKSGEQKTGGGGGGNSSTNYQPAANNLSMYSSNGNNNNNNNNQARKKG